MTDNAKDQRALRQAERHQRAVQRRTWRRERRRELCTGLAATARRLRPVAPLALVTGLAMYGQVSYALVHISPPDSPVLLRVLLAVGVAVAVESIALYVQWHAHDALLNRHTLTAARQRRASYAIALGVAAVNYSHFAGPDWAPNPTAVCFAMFSAVGPWLWGLHTRRAQRVQLSREGQLDTGGAVFSAERYRCFPVRTTKALRWSIDHGITDPHDAWVGYNAERAKRRTEKATLRAKTKQPEGDTKPPSTDQLDEHGLSRLWKTAPLVGPEVNTDLIDPPSNDRPDPTDPDRPVKAVTRAADAAQLYATVNGKLPSLRLLETIAGVSRGTAVSAMKRVKATTNGHQL